MVGGEHDGLVDVHSVLLPNVVHSCVGYARHVRCRVSMSVHFKELHAYWSAVS